VAKTTIPITLIAGLAPLAVHAWEGYNTPGDYHGLKGLAHNLVLDTTGYYGAENRFDFKYPMMKFYGPMLLGMLAHKLAGKVGINRALSQAGVPFIRV
jgi:hypothetical protein